MKKSASRKTTVIAGQEGLIELVKSIESDVVVSAVVGSAGLLSTYSAIEKGITVAIANKEPLVMAGRLMTSLAKKSGACIVPIDSEHSAIWQCLNGEPLKSVSKIILTASGGPFLNKSLSELKRVTVKDALNHPKWKMGKKITIDSSTMMNKGLEVIEARWLFNQPANKISVIVHPQSIVHSMVEFKDSSVIAQLGLPDMRVPIAYALSYPERWASPLKKLDLIKEGELTFKKPDSKKFRCLQLAYDALKIGGTAPAVLNGANEVAVEAFLNGRLKYLEIPKVIEKTLSKSTNSRAGNIKRLLEVDKEARETALSLIG